METRLLQHFLAVAEHGSITLAAEDLNISQPALTKSIQRLEGQLHAPLFDRAARGMQLTTFGRSLLGHARRICAEWSHATAEVDALRGAGGGCVAVGAGPTWSLDLLPMAVAEFLAKRPHVRVNVVGGLRDTLLVALHQGNLDFVIAAMPQADLATDLQVEPLILDDVKVVARAGHPLVAAPPETPSALLEYGWALPRANLPNRLQLERILQEHGLGMPRLAVETDSVPFTYEILRRTDLLSYTPAPMLATLGAHGLAAIEVPAATWSRVAGLIYRRRATLAPAARELMQRVRDLAAATTRGAMPATGTMPAARPLMPEAG